MSGNTIVHLEQAYAWACPVCEARNYETRIPAELTPDEAEEIREILGVPEGVSGGFFTCPREVECRECGQEFPAQLFDECDDPECGCHDAAASLEFEGDECFEDQFEDDGYDEYDDEDDDPSYFDPSLN